MKEGASLHRLNTAFKNLQILVFTMLIKVQPTAHAEEFLGHLLNLITFKGLEGEEIAETGLRLEETAPIDVHFEAMGFKTSDTILNQSSVTGLFVGLAIIGSTLFLI